MTHRIKDEFLGIGIVASMKLYWARNVAWQAGKSFTMKFTMRVKHYTDPTSFQNLETYKFAKDCDIFRLGVFETFIL